MEPVKLLWAVTSAVALLLIPMKEAGAHDEQPSSPRTKPLKIECGGQMYKENSTFAGYVARTRTFVTAEAPHHWPAAPGQAHRFPYQVEYIGQIKYRAACKESATMKNEQDCRWCLQKLTNALGNQYCTRRYVAGVYSADCFVRWMPPNMNFGKQISPWATYV